MSINIFIINMLNLSFFIGNKAKYFNIFSFFNDIFGQKFSVIGLIICAIAALFGYKLIKLFSGFVGFLVGLIIGIGLTIRMNSTGYLLLGFLLGIGLAVYSYHFYKAGVFIVSFVNGTLLTLSIMLLIINNLNISLVIGCIVGIGIGILAFMFTKPTIIISTAITFSNYTAVFLAILLSNKSLVWIFTIIFTIISLFIQMKMNDGLFEGTAKNVADKLKQKVSE